MRDQPSIPRWIQFPGINHEFDPSQAPLELDGNLRLAYWEAGYGAFNNAPDLAPFFLWIRKAYQIDTAIETGTFKGATTLFFAKNFKQVHTIEINQFLYQKNMPLLSKYPNVKAYWGDSKKILPEILSSAANEKIVFYLDAHWYEDWPLLAEIQAIGATHKDRCILVIDDCKVPERPDIPYDTYRGVACCYEYVKESLFHAFTQHTHHYLIPLDPSRAAKLVILPVYA